MKLIGIDYGRRRTGLAVTDEESRIVRGLPTLDRKKTEDRLSALLSIIDRERPGGIVIGLPLDADANETLMSAEIRRFAANLRKKTDIPIHFIDESLTSKEAGAILLFRKKKARRDKGAADRIAACLILEAFLKERMCVENLKIMN